MEAEPGPRNLPDADYCDEIEFAQGLLQVAPLRGIAVGLKFAVDTRPKAYIFA